MVALEPTQQVEQRRRVLDRALIATQELQLAIENSLDRLETSDRYEAPVVTVHTLAGMIMALVSSQDGPSIEPLVRLVARLGPALQSSPDENDDSGKRWFRALVGAEALLKETELALAERIDALRRAAGPFLAEEKKTRALRTLGLVHSIVGPVQLEGTTSAPPLHWIPMLSDAEYRPPRLALLAGRVLSACPLPDEELVVLERHALLAGPVTKRERALRIWAGTAAVLSELVLDAEAHERTPWALAYGCLASLVINEDPVIAEQGQLMRRSSDLIEDRDMFPEELAAFLDDVCSLSPTRNAHKSAVVAEDLYRTLVADQGKDGARAEPTQPPRTSCRAALSRLIGQQRVCRSADEWRREAYANLENCKGMQIRAVLDSLAKSNPQLVAKTTIGRPVLFGLPSLISREDERRSRSD